MEHDVVLHSILHNSQVTHAKRQDRRDCSEAITQDIELHFGDLRVHVTRFAFHSISNALEQRTTTTTTTKKRGRNQIND
jgi:hypothetical protein